MPPLARSRWYLVAGLLALSAIAAQILAKRQAGLGIMAMARVAAAPAERLQWQAAAAWHVHCSGLWEVVSLGLAALAVSSWLISHRRREPGPQAVLLALHALFVLLLFLMV